MTPTSSDLYKILNRVALATRLKIHGFEGQDHAWHEGFFNMRSEHWVFMETDADAVANMSHRVGQRVFRLEIGVPVIVEGVAAGDLRVNGADVEVHLGEPPGDIVS